MTLDERYRFDVWSTSSLGVQVGDVVTIAGRKHRVEGIFDRMCSPRGSRSRCSVRPLHWWEYHS